MYNELLLLNSANHQLDDEEFNNDQRQAQQAHPPKPHEVIYTNDSKMKIEAFLLAPKLHLVNLATALFQPTIQPETRRLVLIHHS